MMRARMTNGTFLFGIDAENIKRLKDGKPLVIDLTLLGGHDMLLITYGDTMADIKRDWEKANGPLPPAQPFYDPKEPQ